MILLILNRDFLWGKWGKVSILGEIEKYFCLIESFPGEHSWSFHLSLLLVLYKFIIFFTNSLTKFSKRLKLSKVRRRKKDEG